jgi:hypothetical protein
MVSVTALTAPLALPFDELEERDLGVLELAARERFALEAARVRGRGLAADDALDDWDLAGEDERLAAPPLLPEPAPRLLAWVVRPLDARVLEATMGPSFWVAVQAVVPRPCRCTRRRGEALSGGGRGAPRVPRPAGASRWRRAPSPPDPA